MSADNLDHYETAPEDAIYHPSGLYLLDPKPQPHDVRIPTSEEVALLAKIGHFIEPQPLPTAKMLADADIHAPNWKDSEAVEAYEREVNAFRDPRMSSRAWAEIEDGLITAQLVATGWDGVLPVMNGGKFPVRDDDESPPPGRGYIKGWIKRNGVWIQAGATRRSQGPHNDKQADYSILTMLTVLNSQGTHITKLPLVDRCTGLFARLSIGNSEVAAKLLLAKANAG